LADSPLKRLRIVELQNVFKNGPERGTRYNVEHLCSVDLTRLVHGRLEFTAPQGDFLLVIRGKATRDRCYYSGILRVGIGRWPLGLAPGRGVGADTSGKSPSRRQF
jgi:hypothetical protein